MRKINYCALPQRLSAGPAMKPCVQAVYWLFVFLSYFLLVSYAVISI
jgi:hypothetical protein